MKRAPAATPRPFLRLCAGLVLGSVLGCWGVRAAAAAPPLGTLPDSALEPAAREAAAAGNWAEAETVYRELVRRQPRSAAAKRELGLALMHEDRGAPASAMLADSLELEDSFDTRVALAENFMAMNRAPSALPHLRRAVAMKPSDASGWSLLVEALVKVDKPDGAADVLSDSARACAACLADDRWRRAGDDVARALAASAQKQIGSGNAAAANKTLDRVAALRPDLPETHLGRGQIARTQGDEPRAFAEFRRAVDTTPDAKAPAGAAARLELARLLTDRGQPGEATTLVRQVVASRGEDVASLDLLGRACEANKDAECARKAYGRLVSLPATATERAGDDPAKAAVSHARDRLKLLKTHGHRRRK